MVRKFNNFYGRTTKFKISFYPLLVLVATIYRVTREIINKLASKAFKKVRKLEELGKYKRYN